jgi:hypothetical protein
MKKQSIKDADYRRRVKKGPPGVVSSCSNPDCDTMIERWSQITHTMNRKFCCRECSDKCRDRNNMNSKGPLKSWDHVTDKPFRSTVCRRPGIFSGVTICANYSKCSDNEATGEPWEFEKNGGRNCFRPPVDMKQNTLGGSFAYAQSPGFNRIT